MVVRKKTKSKRFTTRHRVKVEKKVREHHRKQKKEAKVNKSSSKKSRKNPGIPNSIPGKEEFIQKMLAEHEKEKMQRKIMLANNDMRGLMAQVKSKQDNFEMKNDNQKGLDEVGKFFDTSKKAFYREFKQVIDKADVILVVLDARDPEGSRVPIVEELVATLGGQKRIVFVLNKIDLIPRKVLQDWLIYFRKEHPTIAFRSSTSKVGTGSNVGLGECLGADTLIQLLKNYSRSQNIKTSVRVGVVGYPNVGKSSLINSLKRSKVCKVGATAGITTNSQEIHLDKNITLLDCPGIVFATPKTSDEKAHLFLRNCLKIEQIDDPILPVELILQKTCQETLMMIYTIPRFNDVHEFLVLVAQKMGRLKKGGIPNIESAAKAILGDWNQGKIPFYTLPPLIPTSITDSISKAVVVNDWAPIFDIETINQMEIDTVLNNVAEELPMAQPMIFESFKSSNQDEEEEIIPNLVPSSLKGKNKTDYSINFSNVEIEINPQKNKLQAKKLKESKKAQRREQKQFMDIDINNDSNDCNDKMMKDDDDNYNFATDFSMRP